MEELLEIMVRLRDPRSGCPWDLEQTFQTIAPHTIEEAYEVAEAIRRGDMAELRDELGDLLFQVVFYAQLARENGDFEFADVARAISEKMIRRHPHVFGGESVESAAEQTTEWERHKAQERSERQSGAGASCLDGIALALPALTRAEKLQKRAAGVGFDWPSINGVIAKIGEEVREVEAVLGESRDSERLMDEVGDLLFSCVNLARHVGVDAETSLRGASHKFERRFREMETRLTTQGASVSTAAASRLDEIWEEIKKETG